MNVPGDNDNVPRAWRATDRRQIETHRRLRLFGDAPAAHFHDACRMMAGIDLEATTHLVAHSLRECEGAIRGVMFSMLGDEQRAAVDGAGDMKHREQTEQMCTLLGFDVDDEIRAQWWAWAERLHELTHRYSLRAPRRIDDEFHDWWAQGQAVLHVIAHRFETVYGEALPRVERLAAKEAPVEDDLSELRERVPHGDVAMEQFFAAATPGWFPLLRHADYFTNPPPLQPDEEGRVAYVPWPPGTYLVRLAGDQRRAEVIELARALDGTDNPAAREAIVEIALAVPAEAGAVLAEQVAAFLRMPYQWRLPFKARDLVVHFAAGGQTAAALAVLRALVSPSTSAGERWRSTSLLEEIVPKLFPAVGLTGLELLADLLDREIEGDPRTRERDYSYIWRPSLEGGRRQDVRDSLVTALRDAAALLVEADHTQLAPIVAFLEARRGSIFARLALDLLRRFPDDELVAARLGERERFDDLNLEREWTLLARDRFATLAQDVRERILGWIEAGPAEEGEGADAEERRERWQWRQLVRLGDDLPDDWRARRDELIHRHGEPEPRPLGRAIWSGTRAPLSKEELAARSVEEVREYLQSWTPEGEFGAPSSEGLSRVLTEVVAEDPQRFAAAAESFIEVEPTYARHLLSGLVKAAWNEEHFEWQPVLALASAALERPRYIEGRPEQGSGELDPGWIWTRLEVARLLSAGLAKSLIPPELADQVWMLLATLTEDPEPDLAYEERWADDGMGPSGLALNTVRGAAMQALMQYMWWRREQTPDGEEPRLEERLRDLFDRRLDPAVEPTRTVRSVYGQWFPALVAADHEWAAARVETIFALGGASARLGRAAWDSYLFHNRVYDAALALLRPQYVGAIERLVDNEADDDDVRAQLLGHLIYLYVSGQAELDDDLFGRFLADAPVEMCAQLIETIGIDLMNIDVSGERLERLRALWESRLAAATAAGGDAFRELRGFAWWFGSGRFSDEWSLEKLFQLLEAGGSVDPDHLVIERLASLRETHLATVVRALAALIDVTDEPWFVLGSRDEILTILRAGLQSANNAARHAARAATNRLIARGHPDFGDLLQ